MRKKTSFLGNDFIGLFAIANDKVAVIPKASSKKFELAIKNSLEVEICKTNILNSDFIGIYLSASNKGIIAPELLKEERDILSSYFDKILEFEGPTLAFGNNVCMNSKAGIINPRLDDFYKQTIEKTFNINLKKAFVNQYSVSGSCCLATEKGFIVHYKSNDNELNELQQHFNLLGNKGTINMGSGFVSTGLIANSNGYVVGQSTSGFEEGRIQEALGFI